MDDLDDLYGLEDLEEKKPQIKQQEAKNDFEDLDNWDVDDNKEEQPAEVQPEKQDDFGKDIVEDKPEDVWNSGPTIQLGKTDLTSSAPDISLSPQRAGSLESSGPDVQL